jgi:hypothetical protein
VSEYRRPRYLLVELLPKPNRLRELPQMRKARLARERRARKRAEKARERARRQLTLIEVLRTMELEWQLNGPLLEQMAAILQRPDNSLSIPMDLIAREISPKGPTRGK